MPSKRRKKKKKKSSPALDYVLYLLLRLVSTVLHMLPLEVAMKLASFVGDIMYRVDKRHYDRSMENLRACFPGQPERVYERLTRDSFRLFPLLGVEVMLTPRYVKLNRLKRHFVLGERVGEVLKIMARQDRGCILVTAHYGNWEVLGYMLAEMGFGLTAVARVLDNPHINAYVLGVREKNGAQIVDKRGAMSVVPKMLDERKPVGFTADQDAGKKGMFVNYFNRPASTFKSIGLLAMKYDVPIVCGVARRLGYDFRFHIDNDVIHPEEWHDEQDPLRYVTQRYTSALETLVRKEPGQYLWIHRRWKTQPEDVVRKNRPAAAHP
ncbi:MAG: lysophospholipid acyltransferase family protein [Planctomycetota bacterium]